MFLTQNITVTLGTVETDSTAKCFLCKHKDLIWILSTTLKSQEWCHGAIIPACAHMHTHIKHTHTKTDTNRQRQKDRNGDTERDREIEGQKQRNKDRKRQRES